MQRYLTFQYDYILFDERIELKNLLHLFHLLINLNSRIRSLTCNRHMVIKHQTRQQTRRLAVSVISDGSFDTVIVVIHRRCLAYFADPETQ